MSEQIDLSCMILEKDEGFEPEPYYCSEKYPTIGHGFRIPNTKRYDPLPKGMHIWYQESLDKLKAHCVLNDKTLSGNPDLARAYEKCNPVQKAVLISMAHQIGIYGLLKFKKMIGALSRKDFKEAANQARDSLAYRQTPKRWERNAEMIESGDLHVYYS